jgi:dsRNA-specific ribonuclease
LRGLRSRGREVGTDRLEKVLSYRFRDRQLRRMGLSHRSSGNTARVTPRPPSNERQEFLGDAVHTSIVTDSL